MSLEVEHQTPPPTTTFTNGQGAAGVAPQQNVPRVTEGCLSTMLQGKGIHGHPILQVLTVKKTANEAGQFKYRMVLSDGLHYLLGKRSFFPFLLRIFFFFFFSANFFSNGLFFFLFFLLLFLFFFSAMIL